jgi:hypothetical protein
MASEKKIKGTAPGDLLRVQMTIHKTSAIKPTRKRTIELIVNINNIYSQLWLDLLNSNVIIF